MIKYFKNKSNVYIFLIFLILFLFGIYYIPKVNANFDEYIEENILLSNIKDYSEALHIEKVTYYIEREGIPAICINSEKDHGIAAYYIFTPILLLRNSYPHLTSILWHLYTYLIFFTGTIFLYLLIYNLSKSKKISILTTLLYYFAPRIFIDGLHNNKDIILMSMLIVIIYFGFKLINNPKYSYSILFSIFASIVCNVKIIGIFLAGIFGLTYLIYSTINKKWNRQNIKIFFFTIFLTLLLYIILTPAIWGTGRLELVEFVTYCLKNGVNFRGEMTVLFEGVRHVRSVNPLPWYYVPKMICITLPIITILLFIYSFISFIIDFIKRIINKKIEYNDYIYTSVIVMFIVPFLIAIISKPNIYNGWRHFYFLYSLMLVICSYGVFKISKIKKAKTIFSIFTILTLTINVFYILIYGVANTAYYNILVGRNNLKDKYELDYYDVTSQDAINKFIKSDKYEKNKDNKIYLCGYGFNNRILTDLYTHTNEDLRKRIKIVNIESVEEYIDKGKIVYNLYNPIYATNDMSNHDKIYSYKIFNSEIIMFYKMK